MTDWIIAISLMVLALDRVDLIVGNLRCWTPDNARLSRHLKNRLTR